MSTSTQNTQLLNMYNTRHIPNTAWFQIRNNVPTISWRTSNLDRIDTTLEALIEMYSEQTHDLPQNCDFFLFADDNPPDDIRPIFAYSSKQGSDIFSIVYGITKLFGYNMRPDEWASYWQSNGTPFQDRQDVLYWIGGANPYRSHIVSKISQIPHVRAEFSGHHHYVPLIEQGGYKYLMDMQGCNNGWSARLFALFWMGCVVFVLDRELHEHWFRDNFVPWVHFVPISNDAHDLEDALNKIRSMPDKGEHIATACRAIALQLLTEQKMKTQFAHMLRKHVEHYGVLS